MNLHHVISSIYSECNRTREILGLVVKSAEEIQEIAMNAAVSASHTGDKARVFTDIARHIDYTSKKVVHNAQMARDFIDEATHLILKAVMDQSNWEKYDKALAHMPPGKNRECVIAQCYHIEHALHSKLRTILTCLHRTESTVELLVQHQNRTFAILNTVKIEASNLHGDQLSTVLSLEESLELCHGDGLTKLESIFTLVASMRTHINQTLKQSKETYETRKAV